MTIIVFLGLFLPIVFFGLSVYFFRLSNKNLKLLVAFSGAFLLSLTFNELLPQIYSYSGTEEETHHTFMDTHEEEVCDHHELPSEKCTENKNDHEHLHGEDGHHPQEGHAQHDQHEEEELTGHQHNHGHGRKLGLFILLGFFIQLLLDYLTKGVEHGHVHSKCPNHESAETPEDHGKSVSYVPVLIGLSLHSFLEGMPLAKGFANPVLQNQLLAGIIIHNIPIAIVFMSLLIQNKLSRTMSIVWLMVFALAGPAGVLFSDLLGSHYVADMQLLFKFSMSVVVGIFLHIATTILFETDENHRFNYLKLGIIILGAAAAMIHF